MSSDSDISAQALLHIGQLRYQLRQPQAAIASLRRLISGIGRLENQASYTAIDAYMLMGDIYLQQMHDVQTALSAYMAAKRGAPPNSAGVLNARLPDLNLRIAECYRLMGAYDRAENLLDSMQTMYKSRSAVAQIAKLRGDCYFSRGDFDKALIQYQEAIQRLMNQDWVNDALDRIALIKEYPDHGPQSILKAYVRVERLRKLGQYDEALEIFIPIVEENGENPGVDRIRLEIGDLLALQMKAQEAVSAYEELLQSTSPLAPEAQFRIAGIYGEQLNDPEHAIEAYSALIADYPDSVLVANARKQIRKLASENASNTNLP